MKTFLGLFFALALLPTITIAVPICERSPEIKAEFEKHFAKPCAEITDGELAKVRTMVFGNYFPATEVRLGDLDGLTSLEWLYLSYGKFKTLPAGLFDNLKTLKSLHIEQGQLESIPEGLFRNLKNLHTIELNRNRLTSLPVNAFDGPKALVYLDIGHNPITTFPIHALRNLPALEVFGLDNFAYRGISELPEAAFRGMPALRHIGLRFNELTTLPDRIFSGLADLEWVRLRANLLVTIPDNVFSPDNFSPKAKVNFEYNALPRAQVLRLKSQLRERAYLDFQMTNE